VIVLEQGPALEMVMSLLPPWSSWPLEFEGQLEAGFGEVLGNLHPLDEVEGHVLGGLSWLKR